MFPALSPLPSGERIKARGKKEIFSVKKDKFAVVLTGGEKTRTLSPALKDAGWLEFRVDEFLKRFPEENLVRWLSVKTSVNRIGTVRWKGEHQDKGLNVSEKKRLEIYKKIIAYVDYLDVEIKSSIAVDVADLARKHGKKVIASYHDFSKTPSCRNLEKIYREGRKLQPGIIKMAASVRSKDELFTLLAFTCRYADEFPLVVIPMGVPAVERLMPLYFGSLFTYVSLEKQTAPGQISHKTLRVLHQYT